MYYLMMKTLTRPQPKLTIAILSNHSYLNSPKTGNVLPRKYKFDCTLFFLPLFLSLFLLVPESPDKTSSICVKYHSERVCNTW